MTVPEKKHAPAILITLTEVREVIWNKDTEKLTKKTNVNNLILELDKMNLVDESSEVYKAYETFEKFVRPLGMSKGRNKVFLFDWSFLVLMKTILPFTYCNQRFWWCSKSPIWSSFYCKFSLFQL